MPMISVAMCTYNGSAYLAEQLESIARQTRLPDELLISDDQSTDDTVAIARAFAAAAPFAVRVVAHPERAGVIANFDRAIAQSAGGIVVLADQDDWWFPEKLATIERAFGQPDVGLVFSDGEIVDERLRPTGLRMWQRFGFTPTQRARLEQGTAVEVLWPGWLVAGGTIGFRAELREIILPIPCDLQMLHDGWIAAIVACVGRVHAIEQPLIKWRQHAAQQTGAWRRPSAAGPLSQSQRQVNAYGREKAIIERLHTRASSQAVFPLRPGEVDWLRERYRHTRARSALSPQPIRRARAVFAELVSGRYHRFSRGLLSAVKDLVVGHHQA